LLNFKNRSESKFMRSNTALSFHILAAKEMIKSGYGQLALRGVRSLQGAGKAIPNIGKISPAIPNKINQLGGPATAIAAGGLGAGGVVALNSGSNQSMGPAVNGGIPPMPGAVPSSQPGRIQLNQNVPPAPAFNTQGLTPQNSNPAWNQSTRGMTTPTPAPAPSNTRAISSVPALENLQGAHLPGNMGDAVVPESAPQAPSPMQKPESAIVAPAPLNSDSYLPPAPPAQMSMASERPVQSAPGLTLATPPPMDISAPEPTRAVPPSIPQAHVQAVAQAKPQQPSAADLRRFQIATKSRFNPNSAGDVASMQKMLAAGGTPSPRRDSMNTYSPAQYAALQRRAPMGGGMVVKNNAATPVADLIRKYLGE
jgi:hypothetical protein